MAHYGAVRTALITYGVAAFTLLLSQSDSGGGSGYVLAGLAVQLLLMAARGLIKRRAPDPASAAQGLFILELVADGVTVLLFALGTLGGILKVVGDL